MLLHTGIDLWPVAQQALAGGTITGLHQAQRQQRQTALLRPLGNVCILSDARLFPIRVCPAILTFQLHQLGGRSLKPALNREQSSRRMHRRQHHAIHEIARCPAALHDDDGAFMRRSKAKRCEHIETHLALHLAIFQKHRLLGQPLALQLRRSVQQLFALRIAQDLADCRNLARKLCVTPRRQRLLACHGVKDFLLLRGAAQLPETQRCRYACADKGCECDQ